MSSMKPIILHGHIGGPNPPKVAIILRELGIPYEITFPGASIKQEPFISLNPNGRTPAIEDPNTGITLWESGAIIEYLVETYDKDAKLRYTRGPERWQQEAWKHFQMSGQGPYFGQKFWFSSYHPEKVPSAEDRYAAEIKRVLGVIDAHLTKTGSQYLVGDKCTFADLMWVPWNHSLGLPGLLGEDFQAEGFEREFPKTFAWCERLEERECVKEVWAERLQLQEEAAAAAAAKK